MTTGKPVFISIVGFIAASAGYAAPTPYEANFIAGPLNDFTLVRTLHVSEVAKALSTREMEMTIELKPETRWSANNSRFEDDDDGSVFPKFETRQVETYLTSIAFPSGAPSRVERSIEITRELFPTLRGEEGGGTIECAASDLCLAMQRLFESTPFENGLKITSSCMSVKRKRGDSTCSDRILKLSIVPKTSN